MQQYSDGLEHRLKRLGKQPVHSSFQPVSKMAIAWLKVPSVGANWLESESDEDSRA